MGKGKKDLEVKFCSILLAAIFLITFGIQLLGDQPSPNTPPELENPSLNPKEGDTETTFEYSITYKDKDNDLPVLSRIHIDEAPYEMKARDDKDTNCVDGKEYKFVAKLKAGEHTYKFEFSDGKDMVSTSIFKGPVVKALEKPQEKKENSKPMCYLVSPPRGTTVSLPANLVWTGYDQDGDKLTYTLYIDTSPRFENPAVIQNLTSFSYSIQDLSRGETYYWKVVPNDGQEDGTCEPTILYFSVRGKAVANQPPVAKVYIDKTKGRVGEEITFDARESKDPDGEIISYHWSFGDGNSATRPFLTHTYTKGNRDYFVQLVITDNQGATAVWTQKVYVSEEEVTGIRPVIIDFLTRTLSRILAAAVLGIVTIMWATRKRRRFSKLKRMVSDFYEENKGNFEGCKSGLKGLKKTIRENLVDGKIDKVHLDALLELINGYLEELEKKK
jgi:hypothetical protein